ncbi:MAG TPA: alpha/beta fold hydrolase [Vineibacter sp.]|nr:alpha/beta fold hydrolase [Vineibacter sp.]
MRRILIWAIACLFLLPLIALSGAIAFGTASPPPELKSVSDPFKSVDFSDLPRTETLAVPHGSPVAFRRYGPATATSVVVAIHGSSASSASLHALGKAMAAQGIAVYAIDVRGHGATGRRGDVDYAGQPDDDLRRVIESVRAAHPAAKITLMGFSLGGAFALRNAANANGALVDRTVLLAPVLGPDAPTMKRGGDDPWARPYIPRIVGLGVLNRVGITAFDGLDAIAYAVPPGAERVQVSRYSWRLLRSLVPSDYGQSLATAPKPIAVVVGAADELFAVDMFEPTVRRHRKDAAVKVIAGINHIGLTLDLRALAELMPFVQ